MDSYDESTYGESIAEIYDEMYSGYEESAVELLQELSGEGRVLELGIGTGRIALPLHHRGIKLTGIDSSEAMIEKLREKEGGSDIDVVMGNFLEIELDSRFDLIYIVFNTFFSLLTQKEQITCFLSVSKHLANGGVFLIEAFVPDLKRFDGDQTVRVSSMNNDQVQLEVSQHNPIEQQVNSRHLLLSEQGVQIYPVRVRYAWPSELDLMARLAGLRLKHRWGTWEKGEFTGESKRHISVYETVNK